MQLRLPHERNFTEKRTRLIGALTWPKRSCYYRKQPMALSFFRRLPGKCGRKRPRFGGHLNGAVKQNRPWIDILAVEVAIVILVGSERCSIERNTREQACRARVRQDLCIQPYVGLRRRLTADWPRCCGCISANRELVADQFVDAFLIHEQHHYIDLGKPDLEADAAALNGDERWRGPISVGLAAHNQAFAIFAAEPEPALFQSGNDCYTFGLVEQISGNALIRRLHDFLEDVSRTLKSFDFVTAICGYDRGQDKQQQDSGKQELLDHHCTSA